MTYQALARKWRPQDFSSLIGQEPVVTALRNALVEGRIAQAYLFAGIRGVGKTTAARVLAKALNCERGPAADPCNECRPCVEITRGADLDVLEIDAATYSKVEQVRELTESLKYGPARDRHKVVVLDEVHRLSRQAFDALLKIVEEPPPHLVFIFATTEIEAVPVTILSRCQEYRFRRVPVGRLAEHLRILCTAETIDASDAALRMVARAGEGSVRDAVALLDQLATYGGGRIADGDAGRLLGVYDPDLFHDLLAAVAAGDAGAVATRLAALEVEGVDPRQLFGRFLGYLRDAVHAALGQLSEGSELPPDEAERVATLAREVGYENLLRVLHNLVATEPLVRRSEIPGLALEIALLRAAELPKLIAIEDLLAGAPGTPGGGGRSEPPRSVPPARGGRPSPSGSSPPPNSPPSAAATPSGASARPSTAPEPDPATRASAASPRPAASEAEALRLFLDAVTRRRQMLAAHLEQAPALRLEEGVLVIVRPPEDAWLEKALERGGNRETLDAAVREVWGPDARWRTEVGSAAPTAASAPGPEDPEAAVRDDPAVQAVLDIFDGTIQAVEPRSDAPGRD